MNSKDLETLGLSSSEAQVYFAIVKCGPSTVKEIAKHCSLHRSNIYDLLEKLSQKGLINEFKEGRSVFYSSSNLHALYDLLNEKRQFLDDIFPQLQELEQQSKSAISVEVYRGKEGMKVAFRDIIRTGKSMYGYGIKGQLREKLPIFASQFLRDMKHYKISIYGIYTQRNPPSYYTQIRYVSEELGGPVAVFIYGDTVSINIWEPDLVAILIRSKLIATMYKKHFDLLWKIAKKK